MELSRGIQSYTDWQRYDRDFSEDTVKHRSESLRQFLEHVGDKPVAAITLTDVQSFSKSLHERGMSSGTRQMRMSDLKECFRYFFRQEIDCLHYDRIDVPRRKEREMSWLTAEQVARLVEAIPSETIVDLRDRAAIAVLFSSGMRASECVSLKEGDIDAAGRGSVIGKGSKRRPVYLSRWALKCLHEYEEQRAPADGSGARLMFSGYRRRAAGGRTFRRWTYVPCGFDREALSAMVHRRTKTILGKGYGAHALRHSFATDKLNKGMDTRYLQGLMGHSQISSTQRYTHFADGKLRELHEQYSEDTVTLSFERKENLATVLRIEITKFQECPPELVEALQRLMADLGLDKMKE